ncbi:arginine deiminase family protein [Cryomorphaceae bacterium 1068]|nr:arginine deiminase family protein [Cryomorphaceae bacterium 1068]
MFELNIQNETDELEAVLLGTAKSPGPVPSLQEAYDPKSKYFIQIGEYPKEEDMVKEMTAFEDVLKKYNVEVYRPEVLFDVNQIFSRDIFFVIGDQLVVPNILHDRRDEAQAAHYLIDQINPGQIIKMPDGARAEGGDVMPWNGHIFVGYSKSEDFAKYEVSRTNQEGVDFLANHFKDWEVHAFELNKSDDDPRQNALHLDCCFQPIGKDKAILFPGGFKNQEDVAYLVDFFGKENIIEIDREEMYNMNSNVFSISPTVIVSENKFERLNAVLREKGFTVEPIPYSEISKQEGLLRCSTMPLRRRS